MPTDRERLRATFDGAALLYDEVRPGYPAELFDEVVALSGIPSGGGILEVGCGTGQATLPFARRGYEILCVELGGNLADVARRNLADHPRAEVRTGDFEEIPLPEEAFDLVVSATAFHWLDPAVAYPKAAGCLKPGGGHRAVLEQTRPQRSRRRLLRRRARSLRPRGIGDLGRELRRPSQARRSPGQDG